MIKLAIVIPSGDMVHADFAMSLTSAVAYLMGSGITPMLINSKSSLVQKGRWEGVRRSLNAGAEKIMFIDSDMTFPMDGINRLIHANKKIVCATGRQRFQGGEFVARDRDGKRIDLSHRKGLHEVHSTGLAFALIDAVVFSKVDEPWFVVDYQDERWISEDESFFHQAHRQGYKCWVDCDLTKQIGHIGCQTF